MTINLEKSLAINAPVPEVFERWSNINAYADFMPSVTNVRAVDSAHWLWETEGADCHVEITQQETNELLGWRTSSRDFNSTSTVRLEPLEDGSGTKVIYTAHFPNGLPHHRSASETTAEMARCLAEFARLFRGADADKTAPQSEADEPASTEAQAQAEEQAGVESDESPDTRAATTTGAAGPASALQHTLATVAQVWTTTMSAALQQLNALLWHSLDNPGIALSDKPRTWTPHFEVSEEDGVLQVRGNLPGYTPEHLHVEILDGQLLISGERPDLPAPDAAPDEAPSFARFHENLSLDRIVDSSKVQARIDAAGELRITLPIKEIAQG